MKMCIRDRISQALREHRSQDTTGLLPAAGSPESVMREKKRIKKEDAGDEGCIIGGSVVK